MAFDSVPHRLRVGDVIPAEGADAVIDTANGNREAFYVQHDLANATHTDSQFLVARVLFRPRANRRLTVVTQAGPIRRIYSDVNSPIPGTNYVIEMDPRTFVLGAHASVQFANGAITLTDIAPACVPEFDSQVRVIFSAAINYIDVPYVHVLIRGTVS